MRFWAVLSFCVLGLAAAGPFDRKLKDSDKAFHAVERLTFGARPGDVERVRKMGVDKWIDQQLQPSSIPENPELAPRLKPLATLEMSIADVVEAYPPPALLLQRIRSGYTPSDPVQKVIFEKQKEQYLRRQSGGADAERPPAPALPPAELRKLASGTPEQRIAAIEAMTALQRAELFASLGPQQRQRLLMAAPAGLRREALAVLNPAAVPAADLLESKIYRAVYSNRQLEEQLVDFWFNHFNVFLNKGPIRNLAAAYERDAIRPHVLGRFEDLLLATAKHPAMLFYLDNWQSADPEAMKNARRFFPGAPRNVGLNENYGREILELHTLGVDGGYTQKDVMEVARCFTGWTIRNPRGEAEFQFNPRMHDKNEKTVLGHRIAAGGGMEDGRKVIEILSRHPATARYISTRLAQRFVADEPPKSLVDRMAAAFVKSDGDLRVVMRTMLHSKEFFSQGALRAKIKSPLEAVVSAARALDAKVDNGLTLATAVERLGQPLYRKEEPTGYPVTNEEWVNTSGLLGRINTASGLASGKLPGFSIDYSRFEGRSSDEIASALLGRPATEETKKALAEGVRGNGSPGPAVYAGLVLGSPEFQRK